MEGPYTRIFIRDLRLMMSIGIYESEQNSVQPVLVNVVADTNPPANQADFYVCYDTLAKAIRALASSGHIDLLETFADQIADAALAMDGIAAVTVRAEKTAIMADAAGAGVEIRRLRP